jgi:DNA-binding beta-propeller fold protein YncE
MHVKLIFRLILILFCSLLVFTGNAQDKGPGITEENSRHPYISWVSQYPAHKEGEKKQSTAKRIYDFLVQKNKQTSLSRPVNVLANNPGNFWVLDQGEELVCEVKKNKLDVPKSIRKKENYFTSLVGVCALPDGNILFTDSRLNKVFLLDINNKKVAPLNDTLQLQQPTGIAYSAVTNEIWVTETNAHRIAVLNRNGEVIKRIGSRGSEKNEFNFPTSIWIDKAGDAYIVDAMNFRVQIFNKNGEYLSTFGEAGDATGYFARPKGIATDTYGNIYVADALFHVVQIFDKAGNFLYSFGKQGREKGDFWMPAGIYIDSKNYIYVADSYNSRIQIFQLINGG